MVARASVLYSGVHMRKNQEQKLEYGEMEKQTGFRVTYEPQPDGGVVLRAHAGDVPLEASFTPERADEARGSSPWPSSRGDRSPAASGAWGRGRWR